MQNMAVYLTEIKTIKHRKTYNYVYKLAASVVCEYPPNQTITGTVATKSRCLNCLFVNCLPKGMRLRRNVAHNCRFPATSARGAEAIAGQCPNDCHPCAVTTQTGVCRNILFDFNRNNSGRRVWLPVATRVCE